MQPHRYINELEHWRHTSQRPQQYRSPQQSPLQSPTLSPEAASKEPPNAHDADTASETDNDNKTTSKAFQVESPRGWLEYAPSASYSTERKKVQHTTTNEDTIGTKGRGNNENNGSTRKHKQLENQRHTTAASNATDSQTARDMLCAVSYEDIVKLTQMAAHLPDTSLASKYPSNRTHQRQRSEEPSQRIKHHARSRSMARPSGDFCLDDTRHKPSRLRIDPGTSASTENLTSNHVDTNAVPIVTRSSLSTPPPSTQQLVNARATKSFDPNKNEHRRSWYKPFVKRDKKGKSKDTSFADLQSSISAEAAAAAASPSSSIDTGSSMLRDGSHSSAGSHDIRYLMTISQTESSTPSIGNSEGRASATNNTDPDSHASSSSSDNRKRSSLHPTSLIKGRLIPSSIRASSVDSNTSSTTTSKQKHFRGKPFSLPRRRHSFDSMHSSTACNNEDSRAKRRRRRSSADPLVVTSRNNNNKSHPTTTTSPSPTEENWEVEKKQQPVVHFDNDLLQRSANTSIHSRSPDFSPVQDIRSSFDLYAPPRDDDLNKRDTSDADSCRFYPSGSEDGIKSNRASISDYSGITSTAPSEGGGVASRGGSPEPIEPQETTKTLMFDYGSLPDEVLGLLKEYEKQGKMEIVEKRVRYTRAQEKEEEDEEEEEEEEDDDEEDVIDASQLVGGIPFVNDKPVGDSQSETESMITRKIAIVRASKSDNADFVKLIHLTDGRSLRNGYLLDLHVTMVEDAEDLSEDENSQEDLHMLMKNLDVRIEELKGLTQASKEFMDENRKTIEALAVDDSERNSFDASTWQSPPNSRQTSTKSIHSIKEVAMSQGLENEQARSKRKGVFFTNSPSSASSSSSSLGASSTNTAPPATLSRSSRQLSFSSSIRHVPSLRLDTHLPYRSVNPFDYRQEEVQLGVCALENEMIEFKRALCETEELIRDIQIDISDTRQKMACYIKDMPDAHYSALKKLEVDIESILANRAKNPWLDTGYALLSYLLTLCALLVWIIICALKWGRTVILFPRKLWRTYNEYLLERNKAVKQASLRTVSSGVELSSALRSPTRPRHRHQDL